MRNWERDIPNSAVLKRRRRRNTSATSAIISICCCPMLHLSSTRTWSSFCSSSPLPKWFPSWPRSLLVLSLWCLCPAFIEWWWYEEEIETYGIWIWKHLHEVDCLITSLKNSYENCLFSLDPCVVLILPRNVGRQLQTLESLLWKWSPDKGSMRAPSGYIWISPIWCCMVTIFLRGSLFISEGSVVFFYTHQWISGEACKQKVVRLVILTVDIITISGASSSKNDS